MGLRDALFATRPGPTLFPPTNDYDHGAQEDDAVRTHTPQPPLQRPPAQTPMQHEAGEQLGALIVEALQSMRDLGALLAPAGTGGPLLNVRSVAAFSQRVSATTTPTLALGKNSGRRGAFIYSETGTATCYLGLCTPNQLTTQVYAAQIVAGQLYEIPGAPYYGGEVSLLFASGAGAVVVTELT